MKEINVAEIATLAAWIAEHRDSVSEFGISEEDIQPTALKVIHCVLSLRTSYEKVVVPRLRVFRNKHPNTQHATDLANLIASYPTSFDFIHKELNFRSDRKARILQQVSKYVSQIVQKTPNISEEESLRNWALQAKPQECYSLNIKHFKICGFQYLRMLFGADTVKPDVHVHRCLSELLDRNVSDLEAILLLEEASKREGLSVRSVDKFIWNRGSRASEYCSGISKR